MDWLKKLSDSLDYIEEQIEFNLDIDHLAQLAGLSKFHYQRMFTMLTGFTVAEYFRKRKLTLAAQELASSSIKVIDIALKYGYATPESFAKAFRKMHGISPSEAREAGQRLKAFPRLTFQIQVKGVKDMNYKIIDKEAFKVVGKAIRVSTTNGENYRTISQFWEESNKNGLCNRLYNFAGELGMLGICTDFNHDQEEFTYLIAVENPQESSLENFEEREIPAQTWAIFESIGPMPTAIQDVWKRIFSEWFPATGYEHANGPELEVYLPGNPADENYRCEVWIPIIKK